MIRTTLSIAFLTSFFTAAALAADPAPKKPTTKSSNKAKPTEHATPAPVTPVGWSLANGVWIHPDGYNLVRGKVVRRSAQARKPAPPLPTLAELEAASNKQIASKTAAEIAAEKEAYRLRKLPSRRAPQTGTHM